MCITHAHAVQMMMHAHTLIIHKQRESQMTLWLVRESLLLSSETHACTQQSETTETTLSSSGSQGIAVSLPVHHHYDRQEDEEDGDEEGVIQTHTHTHGNWSWCLHVKEPGFPVRIRGSACIRRVSRCLSLCLAFPGESVREEERHA